MKCTEEMMRLYAVTDRAWVGKQSLAEQVAAALRGGVTCVQLREKELDEERFLREAEEIFALCKRYRVPFFINDNVPLALRCHADGVHVGQDDMDVAAVRRLVGQEMMIGVSVHTVEEACAAAAGGADYLGVGAMFATSTKTDASLVTKETLRAICDAVSIPVVAIGGISKSNLLELAGTGVDGVALVSAIFSAADIAAECRLLYGLSQKMAGLEK
ncbi:thiamine phosphate synthase [Stomatobaculum longum]|uniref:thiamine phosphate synthase n=1 Tax=Stomatobaculum longum TaxID=796942 RepID=UPI002805D095|nr:thiamine phosphate synthase [Stomatobaculum longum]